MILEIEHFDCEKTAVILNLFQNLCFIIGLTVLYKVFAQSEYLTIKCLIKDKRTQELVGYFSLKTGMMTLSGGDAEDGETEYFDAIPGVELSNFAVNHLYKINHPEINRIGTTILRKFILPIVFHIQNFAAVKALYIFALPEDRLIRHYESLGFRRFSPEKEAFVHAHIKPKYDADCIFMYQVV